MLKHLPCSSMNFFYTFNDLLGLCILFVPSGRHLPLFPSIKWDSLSTLLLSSSLFLSSPTSQSFLNASVYRGYSFLGILIPFPLPGQAGFRPRRSTLDQILCLSQSISDRFNKLKPGSPTICITIDFSKAFNSVWHPAFSTNLFRLASLLALLVGLNHSFLIGVLAWFFKITKVVHFESVEMFHKDPFLALYFSFFSSTISLLLCLFPSAALCMLTI